MINVWLGWNNKQAVAKNQVNLVKQCWFSENTFIAQCNGGLDGVKMLFWKYLKHFTVGY